MTVKRLAFRLPFTKLVTHLPWLSVHCAYVRGAGQGRAGHSVHAGVNDAASECRDASERWTFCDALWARLFDARVDWQLHHNGGVFHATDGHQGNTCTCDQVVLITAGCFTVKMVLSWQLGQKSYCRLEHWSIAAACNLVLTHHIHSASLQYNSVPAEARWCSTPRKVTVGHVTGCEQCK